MRIDFALLLFSALIVPSVQAAVPAAAYNLLPMQFEVNQGQTDPAVRFLSRGAHASLFLTPGGAVLSLQPPNARIQENLRLSFGGANSNPALSGLGPLPGKVNYLKGNRRSEWRTGIPTFGQVKYSAVYPGIDLLFYGKQGRLEYDFIVAPGADFRAIRMRFGGARPRIDRQGNLLLTTASGQVSFDQPVIYQVAAGGRRIVRGGFKARAGGEVGFRIGAYDRRLPLIIDPVLTYATYLGGFQTNAITGLAPNSRGQLYVTGYTLAAKFPTTSGVVQPGPAMCKPADCSQAVGPDAFVAKIAADGQSLIFSTYLGGNNEDAGRAVAVDANDNVWVTGYTYSNDFPISSDAQQKLCSPVGVFSFVTNNFNALTSGCEGHPAGEGNVYSANQPDVFLTKLDPAGSKILYSSFLGGSGNDNPNAIALDAQGNIYIAGNTGSVSKDVYPPGGTVPYPETASAIQTDVTNFYGFVPFLTKLSPDAHTLLYSTILGGANTGSCGNGTCGNFVQSMALGANGLVTLGGTTSSPQFPVTPNALQRSCTSTPANPCFQTGFIATIDTKGSGPSSLVYSTYLGGTAPAQSSTLVHGVATDSHGNIYATGETTASNFPVTSGVLQPTCVPHAAAFCHDAFILKLNASGALLWSTYYGSATACCTLSGSAITVDASSNVYVAGQNGGAYDLKQANPFQPSEKGNQDVFLLTLSPDASQVLFGSYFGGSGDDLVYGLALDASNNLYFAGSTGSTDLPVTPNAFQSADPGYQQGFAAKVSSPLLANPPVIAANGIASLGDFGAFAATAPGSWIEIFGSNLATTTRAWSGADFNGPNAPTSLGGVQVSIAGQPAFVYYVSPGQVDALIPSTVAPGQVQVVLTSANVASAPYTITINPVQPGLLAPASFQIGGKQYAVALFGDGVTYVLPAGAIPGVASRPAKPGETIVLYGIGFGPVTPQINAGTVVSQQNILAASLQILFGNTPAASISYNGLALGYTGLYQFNVVVPPVLDDPATPITFNLGSTSGSQRLYIAVHQ